MILLKQVEVYSPEYIGRKDILTGGGVIMAIEPEIRADILPGIQVIEAEGLIAIPGLIDNHVHIAGAGGEGGPST
jgi:beta-aspartyl-dipeptidase (metallo-type)